MGGRRGRSPDSRGELAECVERANATSAGVARLNLGVGDAFGNKTNRGIPLERVVH